MLRNLAYLTIFGFLVCAVVSVRATDYHDGRKESIGSVVRGVIAQITVSPEPDLHDVELAASVVRAMVAYIDPEDPDNVSKMRWAEAGYRMIAGGSTLEHFFQYTTVMGIPYILTYGTPDESYHTYKLEQNGTTGVWSIYIDDVKKGESGGNTSWEGNSIQFSGLIKPSSSVQMMGDDSSYYNKTLFNYFWYKPDGGNWTSVWPSSYYNSNDNEWGHYADSTTGYFQIWDENP